MAEAIAYLSLGGNLGQPRATIAEALRRLEAGSARVIARSGDYSTPPWGKLDQPAFVNAAAAIATPLPAHDLLRLCLDVELSLGRRRVEKWGPRTIDIDLLAYGSETVASPELTLPHPFLLERAFVLVPLIEIAPDLVVSGIPILDALARLDTSGIERLKLNENPLA